MSAPRPLKPLRNVQRVIQALAAAALIAVASAACSPAAEGGQARGEAPEPQRGGELVIGADADPIGLDATMTNAFSSTDFISLIYSGLLRWNADMEIEPDLAVSYENPDPTTYIFKLREGVTFHNGQPLTAADVKYTFDRILDPAVGSPRAAQFSSIEQVTVVDDHTVRFELRTPDAAFLPYLATAPDGSIVPQGVENLDEQPVGTGPFKFDTYAPNESLRLAANTDYYEEGLPYLDAVNFRFFGDQSSLVSALRSGAVDMTWLKDPKVAAAMANSAGIVSAEGQINRTLPVWINVGNAPLDDVRVRRALSLATDRANVIDTVMTGYGEVSGKVPPNHVGGAGDDAGLPYYQRDVKEAKRLLAEAGYPDGLDLGEYKIVAANGWAVQSAQVLQQQWAEAGITIKLRPMETPPLIDDWLSGNFDLLQISLGTVPDPDAILGRFASTSAHGAAMGMADGQVDALIAAGKAELDTERRAEVYGELQEYLADQAYSLDIYAYPTRWEFWKNDVYGYQATPLNNRAYVRTTFLDR